MSLTVAVWRKSSLRRRMTLSRLSSSFDFFRMKSNEMGFRFRLFREPREEDFFMWMWVKKKGAGVRTRLREEVNARGMRRVVQLRNWLNDIANLGRFDSQPR